ncbi:MAG: cob(I)yrinic acid a,c-diamide adenosyltransferase [Deltaproteobacteria bacterium]|nr:cob(I)yrinic acid a,c-diamide adenosyltransferase [Deltaproteobacteria bacterium]
MAQGSDSKKGLIHVYTGEGKGKTTAAIGLAVRAAGQGMKVLFVQFFKSDDASSGEKEIIKNIPQIELIHSNTRHPIFTKQSVDGKKIKDSVIETFEQVKKRIKDIDLLVLDEINSVLNGGWIDINYFIMFLEQKPDKLEVILTGRNAPVELVKIADYVTEMLKIKHPFNNGTKARKGIEY